MWERNTPLWLMNYHGRILRPDLYDGAQAGATSQYDRGRMYETGTFMGDHHFTHGDVIFRVESTGSSNAERSRSSVRARQRSPTSGILYGTA